MKNKLTKYFNLFIQNLKSDIFKIIFIKPRYFFLLLRVNILEGIFGDLYFLSPRCLLIKLFEDKNLKKKENFNLKKFGNYLLDAKKIKKKSIVYSGGAGTNISFDKAIIKKKYSKVRLFDPTPESISFMKNKTSKKLLFYPYAIYQRNKKVKIYFDKYGLVKSNSITNILGFDKKSYYYCHAYNIPFLKKKFKDKTIDILKLDIEGVAIEVMENCFKNNIFPQQILLALEVPMNYFEFFDFYKKLKKFISKLSKKYELINVRDRSRGVELEILCVKRPDLKVKV
jgi:FkbM family methyltransferase